jgi:5-dehydro-4-deoxyglucarate dehydratase
VKIGVIVYNRGGCRLTPASLEVLAQRCPNLIGFKDGVGDIEKFVAVRQTLGDRFAYLGGLPTAEVFAGAYKAMGCPVYSSAVFNFVPRTAMDFYAAHAAGDSAACDRLIREFFLPYIALRNRGEGYAVSIVKAGAAIVGHPAGAVRPPLSDLQPDEFEHLRALIATLGPQ